MGLREWFATRFDRGVIVDLRGSQQETRRVERLAGDEALILVRRHRPDVLLTDIAEGKPDDVCPPARAICQSSTSSVDDCSGSRCLFR